MASSVYLTGSNPLIYIYQAGGIGAVRAYAQTHDVAITDQIERELLQAPDPDAQRLGKFRVDADAEAALARFGLREMRRGHAWASSASAARRLGAVDP